MIWMNLLYHLSMWLFAPTAWDGDDLRPPVGPTGVPVPGLVMPVPPPVPFPLPFPAPPMAPIPGGAMMQAAQVVPMAGIPAAYRIEAKLSNFPTKNQSICCPAMTVMENQKAVVSMGVGVGGVDPKKPARHYQMDIEAQVRENRGSSVLVDLGINMTQHQPGPGAMRKLRTQRQFPLGKAVEVVLADGGPEPICAEVKVEAVSLPMPVAAPVAFVSQCPEGVACQRVGVDFNTNPPVFYRPGMQTPKAIVSGSQLPEPTPIGFPSTTPENPIRLTSATTKAVRLLRNTRMRVVREGDKSKIQCEEETGNLTCSRMTREMGQAGTLHMSAGKERVHLCGVDWKAQADQVEIREDGRVILRGHARISCEKMGAGATIRAEECCFMVRNGAFEKIVSK